MFILQHYKLDPDSRTFASNPLLENEVTQIHNMIFFFRFDTNLIKNDNHSLAIELVQPGFTVLKTMIGSMKDFLIFDVEPAIDPAPRVIGVGDVLILETLVKNVNHGLWNVKPKELMSIDQGNFVKAVY